MISILILGLVFLSGCTEYLSDYRDQKTYKDPAVAVTDLLTAVKDSDMSSLEAILGSEAHAVLSSGDPVADKMQREVFTIAIEEGWVLERPEKDICEMIVGHEQWPFPIPLVKDSRGWWFNTDAGKLEILARRIGSNELAAIGVLGTYVRSQREYASLAHDGESAGIFAQKIRSVPGKQDGLYWPANSPSDKLSPLGKFVAQAATEGYSEQRKNSNGMTPYHGYFFKILTRQGPAALGGAKNYINSGKMTDGFALVAYPAVYGNSGIMTFIVAQDGVVYESDLGDNTLEIAANISVYNPDGNWKQISQ